MKNDLENLRNLKGLLRHAEGVRLAELAQAVPAGQCIIEIGAFKGKSTCYLAEGSTRGYNVPIYSIDPWDDGGQKFKAAKFSQPINWLRFQQQTAPYADLINPIRGRGQEVGRYWEGPPVGLLWIDGDHSFEGALADFVVWSRFVPAGGVVALHDYDQNYEGEFGDVMRVVDEHIAPLPDWEPEPLVDRVWSAVRTS